eukprot:g16125.t1
MGKRDKDPALRPDVDWLPPLPAALAAPRADAAGESADSILFPPHLRPASGMLVQEGVLRFQQAEELEQDKQDLDLQRDLRAAMTAEGALPTLNPATLMKQRKQEAKKQRAKTFGPKWFDVPAAEITREIKEDLRILGLRNFLDPKKFFKKQGKTKKTPQIQVGRVVAGPGEFYSGRLTRKERKERYVDQILSSQETKGYLKRKFQQINANKQAGKKTKQNKNKTKRKTGKEGPSSKKKQRTKS